MRRYGKKVRFTSEVVFVVKWGDGDSRCYRTADSAFRAWCDGIVHNLLKADDRDGKYWLPTSYGKTFDSTSYWKDVKKLKKKAQRRAKPIFERMFDQ